MSLAGGYTRLCDLRMELIQGGIVYESIATGVFSLSCHDVICMKGIFGKKNTDSQTPAHQTNHQSVGGQSEHEIRALQLQVADLIEENYRLKQ